MLKWIRITWVIFALALSTYVGCVSTNVVVFAKPEVHNLSVPQAKEMIDMSKGDTNFMILDVRTKEEYSAGHIPNAVNVDYGLSDFIPKIRKLDLKKRYLVYCLSGKRSAAASKIMIDQGFLDVNNMLSGFSGWVTEGYPEEK